MLIDLFASFLSVCSYSFIQFCVFNFCLVFKRFWLILLAANILFRLRLQFNSLYLIFPHFLLPALSFCRIHSGQLLGVESNQLNLCFLMLVYIYFYIYVCIYLYIFIPIYVLCNYNLSFIFTLSIRFCLVDVCVVCVLSVFLCEWVVGVWASGCSVQCAFNPGKQLKSSHTFLKNQNSKLYIIIACVSVSYTIGFFYKSRT